jgi:hypothetical protein
VSVLGDRLRVVDNALSRGKVPHAFGGAIALAYCTEEPRGTRDVDVNVFVPPVMARRTLAALPKELKATKTEIGAAARDGQVRLWWDDTPVDVFFETHEFHSFAADSARLVPFEKTLIPVLGGTALAMFKVIYNRTRDWADIEAIAEVGALDPEELIGWAVRLLGVRDQRVARLANILG